MKRKQLVSLLLSLVLLAGLVPLTAHAEDPDWALLVDGVPVRESNCDDILGNGVFSYVQNEIVKDEGVQYERILYIRGDYTGQSGKPLIENRKLSGLTVWADAPSALTNAGTVILSHVDLTVTGFKGLTLTSENGSCVVMDSGAGLTLDCLRMKAVAKDVAVSGSGTSEKLDIGTSLLDLEGGSAAVRGFDGDLTMQKTSAYQEPTAAKIQGGAIVEDKVIAPAVLKKLRITTNADYDQDGEVEAEDLFQIILMLSYEFKELFQLIDLDNESNIAQMLPELISSLGVAKSIRLLTLIPKYDFDRNKNPGRGDYQVLLDRIYAEGELQNVAVSVYDPDSDQCSGLFMFQRATDRSLKEYSNFFENVTDCRVFILGDGFVPLQAATDIHHD